jgi:hypothetical protein
VHFTFNVVIVEAQHIPDNEPQPVPPQNVHPVSQQYFLFPLRTPLAQVGSEPTTGYTFGWIIQGAAYVSQDQLMFLIASTQHKPEQLIPPQVPHFDSQHTSLLIIPSEQVLSATSSSFG